MDRVAKFSDLTFQSLKAMGEKIVTALPDILGAIIILFLGWLITKFIVYLIKKVLKIARVDKLTQKLNDLKVFGNSKIKFNITKIVTVFVKWIMMLVFLIIAADIMNWEIVSLEIGNLLRYLPRLFSAIALFMVGIYIAKFVKKAIQGFYETFDLAGSKIISTLVFYIIAIIITITSLNQAGIDTTVITNNVTVILGAFLLAIAIGFGLGSREIISDLLRTFYTRKNFEVGDVIKIENLKGTVVSIDNICMILATNTGNVVIPIRDIVETKIEIIKE
ncbi:mechanosensitive ion channel domain-containing protein [uncultured Dokdonia sp.]|uniref:mechanosensitive ion channel family protein n=1 Tax=uncultured Dokdonia sp. TaxID=575653 RepID=UPI002634AE55|nr:mechanosensitive ion channel domain-containing protein [uncultured Dokdonia sp.]